MPTDGTVLESGQNMPLEVQQWRRKTPKCLLCLDVRVGTMSLGLLQIILHLIAVAGIVLLILRPDLAHHALHHYGSSTHRHSGNHHHDQVKQAPAMAFPQKMPFQMNLLNGRVLHPLNKAPASHNLDHSMHIRLLAFGHRETIIIRDKKTGAPTMFISRVFGLPTKEKTAASSDVVEASEKKSMGEEPVSIMHHLNRGAAAAQEESVTHHGGHTMHSAMRCKKHRYWSLVLTWLSLGFCMLLYYGAKHRRPIYLLPYFTLQVFDYIFVSFTIVGYLSYLPHARFWIEHHAHMPFRHHLLKMNHVALGFMVLSLSLLLLALKAYFMGMVWSCYRHLSAEKRLVRLVASRGNTAMADVLIDIPSCQPEDEQKLVFNTTALPEYEKCLEMPANSFMPPPYFEKPEGADVEATEKPDETVQK